MAKTFEDVNGQVVEMVDGETEIDTNEDIVSGNVSNYFVVVRDCRFEVDKKTYNAVKTHLKL